MNFTVYKSSAGSGKTFTLVKIYLTLILRQPERYRHILAITFTNKAANEMKERVLEQLRHITSWDSATALPSGSMLQLLARELEMDPIQIQRNAVRAQELILHEYGNFSLGTIDSFMHRVVRTFAHDLQLPVNFEIELDTDELLTKAVDLLVSAAGSNEALTLLLMGFIGQKADEEKSWQIEKDLFLIAKSLFNENDIPYIQSLQDLTKTDFLSFIEIIQQFRSEFKQKVQQIAGEALELIQKEGIAESAFYQGSRGLPGYFSGLAAGEIQKFDKGGYAEKAVSENKMCGGKVSASDQQTIQRFWPQLVESYEALQIVRTEGYRRYRLFSLLSGTIYQIALLHEINDNLKIIQQNKNIVPLAEFNKRIAQVVMREPTPFVYERLGERFHHYLIDEFQDTSVMQWQNLLPLVDNSLAGGYYNLVVGDGKQSIYRWRGGEVMQFVNLPEVENPTASADIRQRGESLRRNFVEQKLNRNYRSCSEIVEFNNTFFSWIAQNLPDEIKGVYADVAQDVDSTKNGGGVHLSFFRKKKAEISVDEYNIQKINSIIQELIEHGYRYSDIAILCRANRKASVIANELLSRNIPVISSESLLLSASPDVSFIVNFICWIQNPDDVVTACALLTRLVRLIPGGDEQLHGQLTQMHQRITQDASLQYVLPQLMDTLGYHFNFEQFSKLHLFDLAEEIIRIFGMNRSDDPFLHFFLDAVLNFSTARKESSLADFSEWWEEKKSTLSLIVPEGVDAVKIMTIHKSKGLQFPVVIYPFASESINNRNELKWVPLDDELLPQLSAALLPLNETFRDIGFEELYNHEVGQKMLDLINLLYVVMTRPEQRLFVITEFYEGKQSDKSVAGLLTTFAAQMDRTSENEEEILIGAPLAEKTVVRQLEMEPLSGESMISSSWQNRILLSRRAPDYWETENPARAQAYGQVVHQLFSLINSPLELEAALNHLIADELLTAPEAEKLVSFARKLPLDPEVGAYFQQGVTVKAEADLLLPDGRSYRPDRVVFEGKKAVVIDFKTGKPSPYYHAQLQNYAGILSGMGYEQIEKYLIYFNDEVTVERVN